MRPGPLNTIADVDGLRVGHATHEGARTGATVLLGAAGLVAGVHVMGGAPGTRETDLLAPDRLVERVDALVLSGGSAFGLAAADGAMAALSEAGRGFEVAGTRVPIVPAAILFDLRGGGARADYRDLGRRALAAASGEVAMGSVGAGAGAVAGRLKGGIGSASAVLENGTSVGALVAANPVGGTCCPETGRFWAAPFEEGDEFGGMGAPDRAAVETKVALPGAATTIAIVATDAALTKAQATRMATVAHDGLARAIIPAHTPFDGDLVFAASTEARPAPDAAGLAMLGHAGAVCLARAVARAVWLARAWPGDAVPAWPARFAQARQNRTVKIT